MRYTLDNYAATARSAAAEGFVLLKNTDHALPLSKNTHVALFGRSQFNYYKSGTGSGGMVNTGHVDTIPDALKKESDITLNQRILDTYESWLKTHPFNAGEGWAGEPWFQEEMPLDPALVETAAQESDMALILIGRTAGEDMDNKPEAGSYYLTDTEKQMLQLVCNAFSRTIVLLNVGNIIDMNWVEEYDPSAVAYIWQGGQEGSHAVCDVLMGRTSPSGKLPDTIVRDLQAIPSTAGFGDPKQALYTEDIYVGYRYFETFAPDQVQYPFGFGLSYTTFTFSDTVFRINASQSSQPETARTGAESQNLPTVLGEIQVEVTVTNTGDVPSKEVVQLYVEAPQGQLGKASRSLCAFTKTGLLSPGESQTVSLFVDPSTIASYDDRGVTGHKSAWVLEPGVYIFHLGTDVRTTIPVGTMNLPSLILVEQLSEACAPEDAFTVLMPKITADSNDSDETSTSESAPVRYQPTMVPASLRTYDYDANIAAHLPADLPLTGDQGYKLRDVAEGNISMEVFISQLKEEDLTAIVRGEGMCSPKVTPGIAGAFGGVTDRLKAFGLPIAGCADGPSGIRMDCGTMAFAMPNGTLLASTFNTELCRDLYEWEALELRKNHIDTLLGPGINIHRNPLNGRNFEYFSEDPFLTGRMAVAQLQGMHRYKVTGTIKHFACNSQETNRHGVNAIVSERALREIYLRAFEMAVKEGGAYSIMSSYNPLNNHWTASHYELLTTILRKQWGYEGIVMTDWWAKGNFTGQSGELSNTAAKAQAQNDLFMVNANASDESCDNSSSALQSGLVNIGAYQRNAMNICRYLLRTPAYDQMILGRDDLEEQLKDLAFEGDEIVTRAIDWYPNENPAIFGSELSCGKNDLNLLTVTVSRRGQYTLSITCRASEGSAPLAQIPLTILRDKNIFTSITLNGSEKEWKTFTFEDFPAFFMNSGYIKLRFGLGGMEIKEVRLTLTEDKEDEIKALFTNK